MWAKYGKGAVQEFHATVIAQIRWESRAHNATRVGCGQATSTGLTN